ncbi:MAG: hypothetical protein NVSMB14_09410 [Isosphaeraceae bacterium]
MVLNDYSARFLKVLIAAFPEFTSTSEDGPTRSTKSISKMQ